MSPAEIAREYREESGMGHGYVIVFGGEAAGWMRDLGNASGWMPGCIAIDIDGNQFVATGGNDQDGAEQWEAIV